MSIRIWPLVLVFLTVCTPVVVDAQPDLTPGGFTQVGRWAGGPSLCLAKDGDVVFLGDGARLEAVAVTDSAAPVSLDRIDLPSAAVDIATQDGYVYAVTRSGDFIVIDARDPHDLRRLAALQAPGDPWAGLEVRFPYAYWACGTLRVVDIRNPARPRIVAEAGATGSVAFIDVALDCGIAYTADLQHGLGVCDISDPLTPRVLIIQDVAGFMGLSVHTANGLLYHGTATGLGAFDMSDPLAPRRVWSADSPGVVQGIAASDSTVFLAASRGLLTHPGHSAWPSYIDEGLGSAYGLVLSGDRLYTAHGSDGLVIYDVADPARPQILSTRPTGGFIESLTLHAGRAYLGCGSDGLRILDLSERMSPRLMGGLSTRGDSLSHALQVREVSVRSDRALLLGSVGLQVVDVADPAAPRRLASIREIDGVFASVTSGALALEDRWLFSGPGPEPTGLAVSELGEISVMPTPWPANTSFRGRVADGRYIYAGDTKTGFWVFDAGTDGTIRPLGSTSLLFGGLHLAPSGDRVYLADGFDGLTVLDVGDPARPFLMGHMPRRVWDPEILGIAADGDFVYAVEAHTGLRLIDARDAGKPTPRGFYPVPDLPTAVAVAEGLIYVASRYGGVTILRNARPAAAGAPDVPPAAPLRAVPNPCNPATHIAFDLPQAGRVRLDVFDLMGRRVNRLQDGRLRAGRHEILWPGRDEASRIVAAGSYLVRCRTESASWAVKVTLAK